MGDPDESLENAEVVLASTENWPNIQIHSVKELVDFTWPLLLARAAADKTVTDAQLLQMLKDAHDHGVEQPHQFTQVAHRWATDVMRRGRARVAELEARKNEWNELPCTTKVHRMRRAIDRRFDGPLHRRTRDPAMFEEMM